MATEGFLLIYVRLTCFIPQRWFLIVLTFLDTRTDGLLTGQTSVLHFRISVRASQSNFLKVALILVYRVPCDHERVESCSDTSAHAV